MALYKSLIVLEIEAVQFTGGNGQSIIDFLGAGATGLYTPSGASYWIPTQAWPIAVHEGDWIIRDVNGEVYPCKPAVFEATYEAVNDPV